MKWKIVLSLGTFLLLFLTAHSQNLQITGKVTAMSTGEVLNGATVAVKGGTPSTLTDSKGFYSLTVPAGSQIVVSYAGAISREELIKTPGNYNFELQLQAGDLDEIVVVGYGTQKRRDLTGAISSVKASDLENMPVFRVEQSLQGRIAGVQVTANSGQPGESAKVRIRGTSSLTANTDPIYVVDGIVINGGIEYLNQSDIESIDVLKDAASAAIYGTQGSNGVILVTTKKGRQGKITVNYNGYFGTQAPWRKLDLLNAREYATLMNEMRVNGNKPLMFSDPAALGEGTDWQKAVFNNNARIQNHELSISGSGDKSSYFGSFGYLDQEGIVTSSNSKFQRFTARFNATHQISKRITFGNNVGYTHIRSVGVGTNSEYGTPLNRAINMDPITPVIETDPAVLSQSPYSGLSTSPFIVRDDKGNPYGISKYIGSEILNPLAAVKVAQGYGWSDKIVANAFADIELIKGLKFRSSIGADLAFWGDASFQPLFYLNSINQNITLNDYTRNNNRGLFYLWENTLSYQRTIDRHSFTLLAGTSAQKNKGEGNKNTKKGIPVTRIEDASMNFVVPAENQFSGGYEYENRLASTFGRLIYNYDQRYMLTAILRRDGSTRFGSNKRYGMFPSVSAGWIASSESFFPQTDKISFFKLRASYGVNGNDRIENFAYLSTVSGGRNYTLNGQLITGFSPNAIPNADLQWEETAQTDIGFDATIFKYFNVTFDWFNKRTTNMLQRVNVPMYVGNTGPIKNIASMENKGVELEVGYRRQLGKVNLNVSANVASLRNKVTYITDDLDYLANRQTFSPQALEIARTTVGLPLDYFFGFKTNGLFQNWDEVNSYVNKDGVKLQPNASPGDIRFVDYNGDGVIDPNDRTMIGNPTPDWSYGFTISAEYKGFDFTVFGQGVAGNDVFQAIRRFDLPTSNYTKEALGRWIGEGTSNYFPRLVDGDPNKNFSTASDFFIKDGSYFRIKTLQIGYTLPNQWINRIGLSRVRVYVMGNNLLTFTKYNGFDPEIGSSNGIDRGIYPQPRALMAGINIGF